MKQLITILLVVLLLGGCKKTQNVRTVALLDISGSIYPEEVDREFAEMQQLVSQMKRGDELVLIPITSNARNDTPGHILRVRAPTRRQAFDGDLVAFRKNAQAKIDGMKSWCEKNPPKKTDILGTLAVTSADMSPRHCMETTLLVLSDFIEDDGTLDFATDARLASAKTFEAHGGTLKTMHAGIPPAAGVRMERLRSRDRAALSSSRLAAIDAFWRVALQQDLYDMPLR